MNVGVRRGLRIALAAVLSIALLLTIAVVLVGHGQVPAHDRDGRAEAFVPGRVLAAASAASR